MNTPNLSVAVPAVRDGMGKSERVKLADLSLDVHNPRFGGVTTGTVTQADVLDHIVENFGVEDILSSLSVNGYFEAEPIVARRTTSGLVVAEGNRRLAACLMIAGDGRALRQRDKAAEYIKAWEEHDQPSIDPVPTIIFEGEKAQRELLSYLGVRHISSSKSWDSYAKAAWVADVVEHHQIGVRDIARMIGDQHRTIDRLLQGYYLAKQLIENGEFRPSDSQRSGRGSVSEYPFSWVYTILGYTAAQRYLEIDQGDGAVANPIKPQNIKKGGVLMRAMFGDKKTGSSSAVRDSRQLGRLASLLVNPETLTLIEQGKTVDEVEAAIQHIDEKLRQGVETVRSILRELVARIDEVELAPAVAVAMIPPSDKAARLAESLTRKLREVANPGVRDDGSN